MKEAIHEGLVNVSSLARKIHPEVEQMLQKSVRSGAIIMAINRLHIDKNFKYQNRLKAYISKLGDLILKTNLLIYTYASTKSLSKAQLALFNAIESDSEAFCTFSQGVSERTLLVNEHISEQVEKYFKEEVLLSKIEDLSSITIKLAQKSTEISGIYYYILKQLAWEDIPLVEVLSTTNEITLILENQYVEQSISLLMGMKRT
ncbi:hypothetical protein [Portibacter marinus]|uniref:hypothetical protein n=1 Tax=Portibacter marinus TaxID=2898660 RepID=UPI001F3F40FC|nr:hypothetical protein [Portibacter marinus]